MKMRSSYLWAAALVAIIAIWMAPGIWTRDGDARDAPAASRGDQEPGLPTVRVRTLSASERRSELVIRGRSEADQRVELRAETAGRVISTPHPKGSYVEKGAVVCEIDLGERSARLAKARAAVEQAKLDYEASASLMKKGFSAATEEAARRALLDAAMAALNEAEIDIERTRTLAPFSGVLEERNAKLGVWLGVGEVCATMVDLDPMLIVGQVSERDVGKIEVGMRGTARLVTGEEVEGRIGYIAASADPATRTFRAELHVGNADRGLRDGVTAEIGIPLEAEMAMLLTPAILAHGDDGRIGVRIVDDRNIVRFAPVELITQGPEGAWVRGLADQARVISVGHEYVVAGQEVQPVFENAETDGR